VVPLFLGWHPQEDGPSRCSIRARDSSGPSARARATTGSSAAAAAAAWAGVIFPPRRLPRITDMTSTSQGSGTAHRESARRAARQRSPVCPWSSTANAVADASMTITRWPWAAPEVLRRVRRTCAAQMARGTGPATEHPHLRWVKPHREPQRTAWRQSVRGLVLFHDGRRDAAAPAHGESLLSSPRPDGAGVLSGRPAAT
jgi:hypothetical protein